MLDYKSSLKIISDQLVRCVTSVGANIVEANETKYWLAMLKELVSEKRQAIDIFIQEIDEIGKIIGTRILTMQ